MTARFPRFRFHVIANGRVQAGFHAFRDATSFAVSVSWARQASVLDTQTGGFCFQGSSEVDFQEALYWRDYRGVEAA